jgi:hypothetical protein
MSEADGEAAFNLAIYALTYCCLCLQLIRRLRARCQLAQLQSEIVIPWAATDDISGLRRRCLYRVTA